MKPLWVVENYPPTPGGQALAARRISQGLESSFPQLQRVLLEGDLPPGLAVYDQERGLVRLGRFPEEDESLQFLEQYVAHAPAVDLVHAFGGGLTASAAVAGALRRGVPSLVSLRGNDLDRGFYRGKTCALLRWTLEKASRVTCLSREQQGKLKSWFGRGDGVYIPNSVDTDLFSPIPPPDLWPGRKVVLVCGEMRWKKGFQLVLEVARQARGRFLIVMAGGIRKGEKAVLRSWREEFPAASSDLLEVSWSNQLEVWPLYARADLVWLPSLWEGMPNVVLEAMACARPVLAHAVGGVPDLILPGLGWCLPLVEIESSLEKILAILNDSTSQRVAGLAREHVLKHHSLEQESRAYRGLYEAILEA